MNFLKKPVPVLMYHRVNQPDPQSSLIVSPLDFGKQIGWLESNRFNFLSLDQIVDCRGVCSVGEPVVAITFDDGFRDNYENAFSLLSQRRRPAALFVIVDWVGRKDFLTWPEIRELADYGVTIGSHSLSHRWLPDIQNDRELEAEITESKKRIEDAIGREVRHFSYPVGGTDNRVKEFVKKAGYRSAWIAGGKVRNLTGDPLFSLRRTKVGCSDGNLFRFSFKAWGIKGYFNR